jgi:hypothetical protein
MGGREPPALARTPKQRVADVERLLGFTSHQGSENHMGRQNMNTRKILVLALMLGIVLGGVAVVTSGASSPLTVEMDITSALRERNIEWTLNKSVTPHLIMATPGEEFDVEWTVVAEKTVINADVQVAGTVGLFNTTAISIPTSIFGSMGSALASHGVSSNSNNSMEVPIICPGTGDNTGVIGPYGSLDCSYEVTPPDTAEGLIIIVQYQYDQQQEELATFEAIQWAGDTVGHETATLSDPRFDFEEEISESTTEIFTETLVCPPENSELYVDGVYEFTVINEAFLNGNIDLSDSATVTVRCSAMVHGQFLPLVMNNGMLPPAVD